MSNLKVQALGPDLQNKAHTSKKTFKLKSCQCLGIEFQSITVEAMVAGGTQQLSITGLPSSVIKDSREKIRLLVEQFTHWPNNKNLYIHLLPAGHLKIGSHFELAIFMAAVLALEQDNFPEAALEQIKKIHWTGSLNLHEEVESNQDSKIFKDFRGQKIFSPKNKMCLYELMSRLQANDFSFLNLDTAKEASDIIPLKFPRITGRHKERFWILCASLCQSPCLMLGPPGVGKSYLADWASYFAPNFSKQIQSQRTKLWRLSSNTLKNRQKSLAPHSRSRISEFIGFERSGKSFPGLLSLSHGGTLILDEFCELNRDVREILRVVLDQKQLIRHTRAGTVKWPSDFWLLCTSNPCPCGRSLIKDHGRCTCLARQRLEYLNRLSGPLVDRMPLKLFLYEEERKSELYKVFKLDELDHNKWQNIQTAFLDTKAVSKPTWLSNRRSNQRTQQQRKKLFQACSFLSNWLYPEQSAFDLKKIWQDFLSADDEILRFLNNDEL